jgi:hypothetical protein
MSNITPVHSSNNSIIYNSQIPGFYALFGFGTKHIIMSATITAADINKLRQSTGAGMLDCRKALTESNGDFEAAIDWLRKQESCRQA